MVSKRRSILSHTLAAALLLGLSVPAKANGGLNPLFLVPNSGPHADGEATLGIDDNGTLLYGAIFTGHTGYAAYWDYDGDLHVLTMLGSDALATGIVDKSYLGPTLIFGYRGLNQAGYVLVNPYGPNEAIHILPIYPGSGSSMPSAASADGSIIVGSDASHNPLTWSGTNWQTVTLLPSTDANFTGDGYGNASDISDDGSIITGTLRDTSGRENAVYWQNGAIQVIGRATATTQFEGRFISGDGSTIVGSYTNSVQGASWIAVWTGTGYATRTDYLPPNSGLALPMGINHDGSVIVGMYIDATPGTHALYLANGQVSDLNTLLKQAGVDMTGIALSTANGVSADGKHIAANDSTSGLAYHVYYDGPVAGLTTQADQQRSIDKLETARQSIAIQQDAYVGLMTGDLDRNRPGYELGAFGLYGSAAGGLKGRAGLGDNLVLTAGVTGGTGDYDALSYKGLMGAAALRYDVLPLANGWRAFGQVGGAFGQLNDLSFARDYANGAGTSTGIGNTSGQIAALYARLGLTGDMSPSTQVQLAAELGERWLRVDGYSEAQSTSNPFPAAVAPGTDRQTVGKIAATWSQSLNDRTDFTLRGAVGTTLEGSSGLSATVASFNTMTAPIEKATWVEAGLRIGYRATDRVTVDAYAMGIAGKSVGTAGHVGAGVRVSF